MSILTQILPKKEESNYFIVLGLEENHVRAAVAEITGKSVKILGSGKSGFDDEASEIEAVDLAISMAEKQLDEKILVENVIFALPQFYLEGENVKEEYSNRLKKISKELGLKTHFFVEYAQAINNYLSAQEGSPPTLLLMDLSRNHVTTTLIRIGKIIKNVTVVRSGSLVDDFAKSLPEFESEILPSRIVIFDFSAKSDDVKEELLKFPWHKHSAFLHTPKMEVFANEKILTAIVEAAASSFLPNFGVTMQIPAEKKLSQKEIIEEETGDKNFTQASKFGFVKESLAEKAADLKKETSPVFAEKKGMKKLTSIFAGVRPNINLPKFDGLLPSNLPVIRLRGLFLILPVAVILILFFFLARNYPTATVVLVTYLSKSNQTIEAVFAKEGSKTTPTAIATHTVLEEVTGTKSAKSTGTTLIGEKARGEITVYNKQTHMRQIPKGTILANGPLKFILDDEVKVASASESTEGITFGKSSVKVTAQAIGPESNLPALSEFTFQDFSVSTLIAKNNLPLSGGTSREIDSVSKEDHDNLEKDLIKELVSAGKQKLLQKLKSGESFLNEPINAIVSAKKFNAEVGSEAKELTLEMTLSVEGLFYNQADLLKKVNSQLLTVPQGFKLDPTKITVKVENTNIAKDGNIDARVILTNYFIPELDLDKIKKEITGKSYDEAINILMKTDRIGGVKIIPEKNLPVTFKLLPYNSNNIKMALTSK